MTENDWFLLVVALVVMRPPIDVVARALADRIKRQPK